MALRLQGQSYVDLGCVDVLTHVEGGSFSQFVEDHFQGMSSSHKHSLGTAHVTVVCSPDLSEELIDKGIDFQLADFPECATI